MSTNPADRILDALSAAIVGALHQGRDPTEGPWTVLDPGQAESLAGTPARWIRALHEMTEGYRLDPKKILDKRFACASDEMIVLRKIDFTSLCEHHLLPFTGTADVGYIPGTKSVVGISKLARLVECHARRFQIQERMTGDIAADMMKELNPLGVGVVVRASHSCLGCRGIRKPNAIMVTSSLLGKFRTEPDVRREFLALCNGD